MQNVDWRKLLEVRMWAQLEELPYRPEKVFEGLYKLGPHAYAAAGLWKQGWQPSPERAHVTLLMWSVSDAAASFVVNPDAEVIGEFPLVAPPSELVVGHSPRRDSLLDAIRNAEGKAYVADEVTANGGRDVRIIRSERFTYHFCQGRESPSQFPFAIQWILRS